MKTMQINYSGSSIFGPHSKWWNVIFISIVTIAIFSLFTFINPRMLINNIFCSLAICFVAFYIECRRYYVITDNILKVNDYNAGGVYNLDLNDLEYIIVIDKRTLFGSYRYLLLSDVSKCKYELRIVEVDQFIDYVQQSNSSVVLI